MADQWRVRGQQPGRVRRLERPLNIEFGVPKLVDLNRIEPEANQQVRSIQRFDHQSVGRHAADDADEVRRGLVDNSLHLWGDGDRKVPLVEPAAQSGGVLRIDSQSDQHQWALGLRTARSQIGSTRSRSDGGTGGVGVSPFGPDRRQRLHGLPRRQRQIGHAVRALDARRQRTADRFVRIRLRDRVDDAAHRLITVVQRQQLMRV